MLSLLMTIAGGIDWKDAYLPLVSIGAHAVFIFIAFVLVMTLAIMNVVVGIFCQCAIEAAASDKEGTIEAQILQKRHFIETLTHLFGNWDETGDSTCTLKQFMSLLADESMQALLRSVDIEVRDALVLFELLDQEGNDAIKLEDFINGCLTLRGSAKAVHMEKMNFMNKSMSSRLEVLDERLGQLVQVLGSDCHAVDMVKEPTFPGEVAESS